MKQLISFLSLCLCAISAFAQFDAILDDKSGTPFTFFVNDADMTCEIRDERQQIDDRKYAIKGYYRKLLGFKKTKGTRTLDVPEKVTLNGKEYTITAIGRAAFAGYENVDYIKLPATITRIGDYAFFRSSIHSITLPPRVSEVGKRAFGYCKNLKEITMTMGSVLIPKEAYAESRNCKITFKGPGPDPIPDPDPDPDPIPHVISDVDVNLPVADSKNENLFAVIIANENYQSVASVDYALHDGEVFKQYCQTVLGIPDKHVHFLKNATLNNMKQVVNKMRKIADAYEGEARFIFYYAGHGFPDDTGKSSYLLPADGVSTDTKQGYSLVELYQQLGALNTKSVVVFMDACFSGSRRGEGMLFAARSIAVATKAEAPKGNMVVFSAAQGDETANPYPNQRHGLFTYYLLKKLKESPNTTLGELGDYIKKEVQKYSTVEIDKSQTPDVYSSPQIGNSWRTMRMK